MMRVRISLIVVACVATAYSCAPPAAIVPKRLDTLPADLQGEMIRLRVSVRRSGAAELQSMLVYPRKAGRYPLALISHGSSGDADANATLSPSIYTAVAVAFARRGFVVLVPNRRGYGESSALPSVDRTSTHEGYARAAAEDIVAAVQAMTEPGAHLADTAVKPLGNRVLLIGQSAGGFSSIAVAALQPPWLVGVINFAGGLGGRPPGPVYNARQLVAAFADFGGTSRVPTLWIYAANDHLFGPEIAQAMFNAFRGSGGLGDLEIFPPYGTEGHGLMQGTTVWKSTVDLFLRSIQLPAFPN